MKCIYCGEDFDGTDYTQVSAHKRRCANLRRVYKPVDPREKEMARLRAETRLAGFMVGENIPAMSGYKTKALVVPVEQSIDKLISMVDQILSDVDIIEKQLQEVNR